MTSGSVSSNVKFSFWGGFLNFPFSFIYLHLSPTQLHNPSDNDDKEGKEFGVGKDVLSKSHFWEK